MLNATLLEVILPAAETLLCAVALCTVSLKKKDSDYRYLQLFLLTRLLCNLIELSLLRLSDHGISKHLAYSIYFPVYWTGYALETILAFLQIHKIFDTAMAPLQGLRSLGQVIFRWVASISIAISLAAALMPHEGRVYFLSAFVNQLQRTQSILTLCLLLFVCFAIRPMGLTYRSRVFGAALGLGTYATTSLVVAAISVNHSRDMSDVIDLISGLGICLAFSLWTTYFALPEPKRRLVVLPTTSPFLRWNQISSLLGDEPGYVAIGGISPDLFAPAEIEVMRRASAKITDIPKTVFEPEVTQHSQSA